MGSANIKTLNLKKYKKINILESAVFLEQEIGALFVFVTRMAGFASLRPEQIQITQPYRQATVSAILRKDVAIQLTRIRFWAALGKLNCVINHFLNTVINAREFFLVG